MFREEENQDERHDAWYNNSGLWDNKANERYNEILRGIRIDRKTNKRMEMEQGYMKKCNKAYSIGSVDMISNSG